MKTTFLKIRSLLFLTLYYCFAQYLPSSYAPIIGKFSNAIRVFCVKRIFKHTGHNITIDRLAYFGSGKDVVIGDYSGIGSQCKIPNNIVIGKYVMMGPEVYMISNNHIYEDIHTPMCFQGKTNNALIIIGNDCWIGARAMIMSGRRIDDGCIIAANSIVTKDIEPYSIIGGNPARLIKKRI